MKSKLSVLFLAMITATSLHATDTVANTDAADYAQIQRLVDHFKDAIHTKNGDAMRGMLLPGGTWADVLDKDSFAKARAVKTGVQQFTTGDLEKLAKFVGTAPKPIDEIFDNVHIETDGIIGTVSFNYKFLMDSKLMNHGVETWQLVHTEDGWKISAMLYSDIAG
jgi:hypothetical protein